MSGALLVAGTASDAGKSIIVAGLCRWLRRQGVHVAPFKAQNMANNSAVTPDGAEIGRAQAMQAAAAGVAPSALMNPVLLKPGSDSSSQVVVLGAPVADVTAMSYRDLKPRLLPTVLDSLAELRGRFDVVVCEGAGSPAEINLRDTDIANMGLARAAGLPVLLVGDIDRGGVFASLFGTLALLDAADQALIAGFVVNKFRGDPALLTPGLDMLRRLTGRASYGVLPWLDDLWLDGEDSLALDAVIRGGECDTADRGGPRPRWDEAVLRVAVVRLPRISNFTDVDALAWEPGVAVRFVTSPGELADSDLVVLPGTRATVDDLAWLRARRLDAALAGRATEGRPLLGICGGYQMLARTIVDDVESRSGPVTGLGLLPARVRFAAEKTRGRPAGSAYGHPVTAYEIHHGVVTVDGPAEPFLDGCRVGSVWGTTWHGAFENDGFRRAFLAEVAALAGRPYAPSQISFASVRETRLDALGAAVGRHLDTDALWRLIEGGPPTGLPFVPPGPPR